MKVYAHTLLIAIMALLMCRPAFAGAKLLFVTDPFPPYYYEEKGKPKGIQYELAALAFEKIRTPFEIKFLPWKRAVMTAEAGNADGVFGLRRTKKRERWLIYPDEPLMIVRTVIFHRKDTPFNYSGTFSLTGKKVGITKGYTYGNHFDRSDAFIKEETASLKLNFLKLMAGRIDLVAAYRAVGIQTLKEMELESKITFSPKPINSEALYLGFARTPGNGERAREFGKALREIKDSPECEELIKRLGFDREMITPCN